jgi:hypothetical protein
MECMSRVLVPVTATGTHGIRTTNRGSERCTHLFDCTFLRADGVAILELVLCEVELRYGDPVPNLMDCSLKLGLGNGH